MSADCYLNARLLLPQAANTAQGNPAARQFQLLEQGAVVVRDGLIDWCGAATELPAAAANCTQHDLQGRLLTPALIDCHTHIVHGGNRAVEFEQRLTGISYAEIAAAGGGIVSTVTATRAMGVDELLARALPRVDALLAEGVCVIEVKSGYGLDRETELNMLRAARRIAEQRPVRICTSFLGAHALPKEFSGKPDQYIDEVCIPALAAAHAEGLVDFVDGFCESIAFDTAQIERVFEAASELGLPVKLHAEQLSRSGATELACRFAAVSVDHLEYLDEAGVRAMAESGSVAVMLPGAFYTLHETRKPPIDLFRQYAVPMAVATDCNPGSSPLSSLLLAMNMACTLFAMTPAEAFAGATEVAARALGLDDYGSIARGKRAELAIWDVQHPAELCYRMGFNPLYKRIQPA